MKKAYLSGLGVMGRRHLKGLVRAGAHVVAFDPDSASHARAASDLAAEGLSVDALTCVTELPAGEFDAAVFSETAAWRHENLGRFLACSRASRFLLEKPLSSNPEYVEAFPGLFSQVGVPLDAVCVNFPRRLWGITQRMRELAAGSRAVQMTINGGAFGMGCNGIHYLDAFLFIAGAEQADIQFCELDTVMVASGRGSQFADYGARFLLRAGNVNLFCSTSANSSAPVMVTVRGDHFLVLVDEANLTWKMLSRAPSSKLPNYRYGGDYEVVEKGPFPIDNLDVITQRWMGGATELPTLSEALPAHRLLHGILNSGGAKPPFSYT